MARGAARNAVVMGVKADDFTSIRARSARERIDLFMRVVMAGFRQRQIEDCERWIA